MWKKIKLFLTAVKNFISRKISQKKNWLSPAADSADTDQTKEINPKKYWLQIKYLPKFLTRREKIIVRFSLLLIIFSFVAIVYFFLNDNLILKPAFGGAYTENMVGGPQNINPLYSSLNEVDRDLERLLYAGLVRFDTKQNPRPDLAEDWFIDQNEKKYTFRLRQDIFWHDEKQFSADDVIFTFTAVKNQTYQSPLRPDFREIEIKKIDNFTVQFISPDAPAVFLKKMRLGILPGHIWSDILPENAKLAELNIKPIGLGPFSFHNFVKDKQGIIKSYTITGKKNYRHGGPYLEQITFKFFPDFSSAVESLKNKNADGINFLPLTFKEILSSRKDLSFYSLSLPQYTAIFFNQEKNSSLGPEVREALAFGVNRQTIVDEIFKKEATAIDSPILPHLSDYENNQLELDYQPEMATAILATAGWSRQPPAENATTTAENIPNPEIDNNGQSKYLLKDGRELALTLTASNQAQSINVAELIKKFWQSLGVKTTLNFVDTGVIEKNIVKDRDFEALLFGELIGSNFDLYPFWHSSQAGTGGLNLANFKNEQADKILEQLRAEQTIEEKNNLLRSLAEIITKEHPAIFLYTPKHIYPVSQKIKGISLEQINYPEDRFNEIEKWYLKTKKRFR